MREWGWKDTHQESYHARKGAMTTRLDYNQKADARIAGLGTGKEPAKLDSALRDGLHTAEVEARTETDLGKPNAELAVVNTACAHGSLAEVDYVRLDLRSTGWVDLSMVLDLEQGQKVSKQLKW